MDDLVGLEGVLIEVDATPPPQETPRTIVVHQDPIDELYYSVVYWESDDGVVHAIRSTDKYSTYEPWRMSDAFVTFTVQVESTGKLSVHAHTPCGLPVWRFQTVDASFDSVSLFQNVGCGGLVLGVTRLADLLDPCATSRLYIHMPFALPAYAPEDVVVIDGVQGIVTSADMGYGISLWVVSDRYKDDGGTSEGSMVCVYDLRADIFEVPEATFLPVDFARVGIYTIKAILAIHESEALVIAVMENGDAAWTRITCNTDDGTVCIHDPTTFGHYLTCRSNSGAVVVSTQRYEDGYPCGDHQVTFFTRYSDMQEDQSTAKIEITPINGGGPTIRCQSENYNGHLYDCAILQMFRTPDVSDGLYITLQAKWGNILVVHLDHNKQHHVITTIPIIDGGLIKSAVYCVGTPPRSTFGKLDARDRTKALLFTKEWHQAGVTRDHVTTLASHMTYRDAIKDNKAKLTVARDRYGKLLDVNKMLVTEIHQLRRVVNDYKAVETVMRRESDSLQAAKELFADSIKGDKKADKVVSTAALDKVKKQLAAECKRSAKMQTKLKDLVAAQTKVDHLSKELAFVRGQRDMFKEQLATTATNAVSCTTTATQTSVSTTVACAVQTDPDPVVAELAHFKAANQRFRVDRANHDRQLATLHADKSHLTDLNTLHASMVAQVCSGYMANGMSVAEFMDQLSDSAKLHREITILQAELASARAYIHTFEK